ncbi:hypothetical protein SNEBB_008717 [Seison nebaliae]|nr:hypothetical protein SNEBB_008717 [Seison nebaliae]
MGIAKGKKSKSSKTMKKKVYETLSMKDEKFRRLMNNLVDDVFDKKKFHVYAEDDDEDGRLIYSTILNKTNISQNNNKFYTIQLLVDDRPHYYVCLHWGRVQYKGQKSLQSFNGKLDKAKQFFYDKLFAKSGNDSLTNIENIANKYQIVEMDIDSMMEAEEKRNEKQIEIPQSKLATKIQELIEWICDITNLTSFINLKHFDEDRMPLGKLSEKQILKGYEILKDIDKYLRKHQAIEEVENRVLLRSDRRKKLEVTTSCSRKSLDDLTSKYYTIIPHKFGRSRPIIINNKELLQSEMDLLKVLSDIEMVNEMFENKFTNVLNPIDRKYAQIGCKITFIDKSSKIYKILNDYLELNHSTAHSTYKLVLEEAFEIEREDEIRNFVSMENQKLLWHGSQLSNWAGILGKGLLIAPKEAPKTGSMFDKGIYFADSSSKSANYSFNKSNVGCLILCQVSLGKIYETFSADYNASQTVIKKKCDSLKGVGKTAPELSTHVKIELDDELVTVPIGRCANVDKIGKYSLIHNEYVVYSTNQVRIRYLLKIRYDDIT